MKVVSMNEVPKTVVNNPLFTGADVTGQELVVDSKDLIMHIVNFGKGVRNKFHTHESDQILVVTAGTGTVATEQEENIVTVGDVILFPAGEKHWHGATKDSVFSHIFVTRTNSKTTQLEK